MSGYPTSRMHPRSLAQAFPDVRASWGDQILMSHFHRSQPLQPGEFVSSIQPEAASACSEFGHEDQQPPKAQTVTTWTRIKHAVRAWWVSRTYKP